MTSKKLKSGFIFKEKYGIDPSTLTLAEIDKFIFDGRKPKVSKFGRSIFPIKDYNINKLLRKAINEL